MRFITEIDLRNEFRKHPFQTYYLNESDRLTSEARQFLQDRQVTITREEEQAGANDPSVNSDKESCENDSLNGQAGPWSTQALVLYAELLEVILLAKESHACLCDELYSMSLVIKQFSVLELEQEVQLNYAKTTEEGLPDTITLTHLFSENGSLIVRLFKLEVSIRAFKEEYQAILHEEQVEQLEGIGSRLRFLTAQLIGE